MEIMGGLRHGGIVTLPEIELGSVLDLLIPSDNFPNVGVP